ncbi:MAG TPA: Gfo/Idh/MocA family oxidoreductase [Thermodesulfobacteriota bacterium]|nr:Gfo/Idh/MocA family oxidoreductase [Thermodesulfobacteriota bacterium]
MMERKEIGIAVVGAGRMGTLRANLATVHPAVRFVAVSDIDPSRARTLADKINAQIVSNNNLEVISRPEVNAVIVSTSEHEHFLPVLQALESKKSVLVEKPIALNIGDADRMIAAVQQSGVSLHVGYSQRFKRGYLLAKEQILQGRLGQIIGGTARVYNSRAQAFQILKRSPHATPVLDVLTYYVDLICWYLKGNAPVEVVARAQKGVFKAAGYSADDLTWAILTFTDGAVVSLGVDYAFPEKYPTLGQSPRLEILGTEGVMLFDEERKDQILYTDRGFPHGYVPGHSVNMAFLSSTSSGDWALGDFWGPLADETRAWLDHLSTGRACALATPEEARTTLEVTLAVEKAARTKEVVRLPLQDNSWG